MDERISRLREARTDYSPGDRQSIAPVTRDIVAGLIDQKPFLFWLRIMSCVRQRMPRYQEGFHHGACPRTQKACCNQVQPTGHAEASRGRSRRGASIDQEGRRSPAQRPGGTDHKAPQESERVRIVGLGILQVRKRAARMGRNPATGEAIKIKASRKVAFRAAKDLKLAV
jgi:hypothetical protein